jgi:hypothetical protein
MTGVPEGDDFIRSWNGLARRDRLRVRRLVRMGRPLPSAEDAALGVAYARFQRSKPWARFFWLWFLPGLALSLGIAAQLHPVVVGVVLALAAQAVFAHRNLGRAEKVNSSHLAA